MPPARVRDVSRYGVRVHQSESVAHAISTPIQNGITSIGIPGGTLDLFYEDRGSAVTVAYLHAALPQKVATWPFIGGAGLLKGLPVNRLAIADPNVSHPSSPSTGWYAGTRWFAAQSLIPSLVQHVLASGSGQRALYFGASAGGFGALIMAGKTPGSSAIVVNPRTDLYRGASKFPAYAPKVFPKLEERHIRQRVIIDAAELHQDGQHKVLYIQNRQDSVYWTQHMMPFREATANNPNIEYLFGEWGVGHVTPPLDVLRRAVTRQVDATSAPAAVPDVGVLHGTGPVPSS